MGRSPPGTSALSDQSLADEASMLASMLRFCADRWRSRIRSGQLSGRPIAEVKALLNSIDQAAGCLEPTVMMPVVAPPFEESEDRFRTLVDSVRDYAIFMLDRDGAVASWNVGAQRLKGYRAEEIVGRSFAVFYTPADVAAGKPARELRIAADDGRYEEEGWRVRKDGTRFWANVLITAVRDASGRLVGYAKVTRDITERHVAEEALRRSEERFRLLVETVRDYAIFMLDPDGRVATWNTGAERIKQYSAKEIVGRHFSQFYPPEDVARGKPANALALAMKEGVYAEEGWRIRKDGTRFWANVLISPVLDASGALLGFAKVTRDLTERKAAEEAIQASHAALTARSTELARLNQELESFSYSLSHDIRSPLRKISASATMLDTAERTPEERAHLDRLHTAVQTIDGTISGMLTLAGVHRAPVRRAPIDLAQIATSVLDDLRLATPAREVETHVPPTLPAAGDAALVRIILDNLLRNAWKFTGRNAEARIEVGVDEKDGRPAWFVRDNGPGFDMRYADKLFVAFERLHSRAQFPGNGIGLATVQAAVRRHGGQVWAESELGEGATFWFTLGPEDPPHPSGGDRGLAG